MRGPLTPGIDSQESRCRFAEVVHSWAGQSYDSLMHERSRLRIGESLGEAVALGREVREWRLGWESVDAVGMHLTQLDLLCDVVTGLTDEIARRIGMIDPAAGDGA